MRFATYVTSQLRRSTGRQKGSELHHWGELLHDYYTFGSVHNGDHDGAIRIFVGLSYEPWGLIIYLITFYDVITLRGTIFYYQECKDYITWHNISPTRSVISISHEGAQWNFELWPEPWLCVSQIGVVWVLHRTAARQNYCFC